MVTTAVASSSSGTSFGGAISADRLAIGRMLPIGGRGAILAVDLLFQILGGVPARLLGQQNVARPPSALRVDLGRRLDPPRFGVAAAKVRGDEELDEQVR